MPEFRAQASPFEVKTITDEDAVMPEGCQFLPPTKVDHLIDLGFKKVICPFGVLIVGTPLMPDSYL